MINFRLLVKQLSLVFFCIALTACSESSDTDDTNNDDGGTTPEQNSPPTVTVTNSIDVDAGDTVTLTATTSDSDGDTLTVSWSQTSGSQVSISNSSSASASFVAPDLDADEQLVFEVSVSDGNNDAVTASVSVNVAALVVENTAPTIDAGADQTVNAGQNVIMAATATDADGDTLTISWTRVGADQNPLANSTSLTPSFAAPDVDTDVAMEFQLSVDDGVNAAVTDNVIINVVAPTEGNSAPTVSAGDDATVGGGETVTLSATVNDADDDSLTIAWTQNSGTTVSITNADAASATFMSPDIQQNETLVFTVSVDDGVNAPVTDQVSIFVESEATQSDLVQTHLDTWIINTNGTTSTYINSLEENVQSAELVSESDGAGNDVEYIYVEATGIADYEFVITQDQIDELNARPSASSEFSSGVTTSEAGDTIKFGEDMGFRVQGSICSETGGEGFWPPGLQCPENVEHQAYFAAEPVEVTNEDEYCETGLGTLGLMVNGTSIFDWGDGVSYNDEGVWYNLAPVFEEYDVDVCGGHSANGEYHHHFYSSCLANLLGDTGDGHSPIYGFAADGYPVYGPYESDGVLAISGWVVRDYGASTTEGGCGTPGERSCVLNDQWDISQGVDATVSAGPDLDVEVTSQSGNPIPAVSGVYYEDFYYGGATVTGAQLDDHNGHNTNDGRGYHYHITVELDDDGRMVPSFPYQIGPRFKGEIPDNGIRSCSGSSGGGPGGGGPPGG